MSESQPIVYIVDDDKAVRDSLEWLFSSVGLVSRSFESGQAFLEQATPDHEPGCLVLDVRLPGMNGLELHDQLMARGIWLPTIMITGHGDVSMAVRAMKSGVIDFLEKPFSDQVLLDRIRTALERNRAARRHRATQQEIQGRVDTLTGREQQVMDMVVTGKLNKQIAAELGLSHKTVEVHRARVMDKMQAASLAELVRMAMTLRQPPE